MKKFNKMVALLLVAAAAVTLAACGATETAVETETPAGYTRVTAGDISMCVPESWEKVSQANVLVAYKNTSTNSNVNVVKTAIGIKAKDYTTKLIEDTFSQAGMKLNGLTAGVQTLNGRTFFVSEFTYMNVKMKQFVVDSKKSQYTVTLTHASDTDNDAMAKIAESIYAPY